MAVIVRITSADGSKTFTKVLPAVPTKLQVPAGAIVEVIDQASGRKVPLAFNRPKGPERDDDDQQSADDSQQVVTVETVDGWPVAEASLAKLGESGGEAGEAEASAAQADDGSEGDGGMFDGSSALLIGGLVVAAGVGVYLLVDDGGNKDKEAPLAPTGLDLAAADDSGASNTDNTTSVTTALTISGTTEGNATVELFDGATSLGSATADGSGAFTKDVNLAAGAHSITAKATDKAGNVGPASTVLSITVDATAPAVPSALDLAAADDTGASDSDNITSQTAGLTISGKADASSTVELFDGATSLGTVTADATGAFTKDVSLAAGTHSVTAKASDAAGNASAASAVLSITVDASAPAVPAGLDLAAADDSGASNSDNITDATSGLTISGTAEPGSSVQLFDGATSLGTATAAATTGAFSIDVPLASGSHALTARASDAAGNQSAVSTALNVTVGAAPDFFVETNSGTTTADVLSDAVAGNIYTNFHSKANPTGEIRGQLVLVEDNRNGAGVGTVEFDVALSGGNEVPAVATGATGEGHVVFTVAAGGGVTYDSEYVVNNFDRANLILGHFHEAAPGVNGLIVEDILTDAGTAVTEFIAPPDDFIVETASGSTTAQVLANAVAGNLYTNFHSKANPTGEVRGQLVLVEDDRDGTGTGTVEFKVRLSGENEVPAVTTDADGGGRVVFTVSPAGAVTYDSEFVVNDFNRANLILGHFHNAAPGVNGPIVEDILLDAGTTTTTFVAPPDNFTVETDAGTATAAVLADAVAGNIYTNFHSKDIPTGEIRGQLVLVDDNRDGAEVGTVEFSVALSGDNEVPAAPTNATGTGTVVFTVAAGGAVTYDFEFTINDFDRANLILGHFHKAAPGVNGAVVEDILADPGTSVTAFFDPAEAGFAAAASGDTMLDGSMHAVLSTTLIEDAGSAGASYAFG